MKKKVTFSVPLIIEVDDSKCDGDDHSRYLFFCQEQDGDNQQQKKEEIRQSEEDFKKVDRWYSSQDIAAMRAFAQRNVEDTLLEQNKFDTAYNQISKERIHARKTFVRCLLEQQNEHRQLGIDDPQGLFQFSKSMSRTSKKRAIESGKSMAEECNDSRLFLLQSIDLVLEILEQS